MLDEEFEKRKERARLLRNSVGMITSNDTENNSSFVYGNDFQEKLNKAKELRNSIGMITSKDLEEPENQLLDKNIDSLDFEQDNMEDMIDYDATSKNYLEAANNAMQNVIKTPEIAYNRLKDQQQNIDLSKTMVNEKNTNTNEFANNPKERINVLLNNNKPSNLLTEEERLQQLQIEKQAKQYAEETNSDKNLFSQIGKTIENLWLGITSNAKSGAKYLTQTQHTPQQEAELLQGNKNLVEMVYKNNNNPITNKAEKQSEINKNLSGLKNGDNFAWSKKQQTLADVGAMSKADERKINQEIENSKDAYGEIELNPLQRNLSKSIVEDQNKIASNVNKIDNPIMKKLAELAPSTGNTIAGAGLSIINPYLGMNYFMINAAGMYEADGRARGMSKTEARAYGTIMGYAEGATEMIQVSDFLKAGKSFREFLKAGNSYKKAAIKEAIKHYGLDMADNAVQEAIIDPIDELTAQLTSGKTKHDYSKNSGWNELIKDMVQDGINGALSALLMNGIDIGINSSVNLYNKIKNNIQPTKQDIITTYTDIQNNPNIDVAQHVKDSMEYQKQKILKGDNQLYSVVDLDENGDVTGITQVIGSPIELKNKNLNIEPIVIYKDGNYNIIDAKSGLKLDTTLYDSKEEAIKGFENIINKADNATIENVNEQITKTKLALINKMQDIQEKITTNPQEAQRQNKISFVDDNKIYSQNETKNILNKYNIETNLNNRPYLGQEINDIINTNIVQSSQMENIGTFNNETPNYTTENTKTEYEPNSNKKGTIKRTFEKEIENHKNISKSDNKINGSILEINNNLFNGISNKKQGNFMNEYLKNEVKGHDYYVDGEKIIANKYTIGKLKNGRTLFDNRIDTSIRHELKWNVIGNLDNIIKNSKIYQQNLKDTKNHVFADTFDRRTSNFKYKNQNYKVMFEIGKKNGVNTLYGIENIKKISNSLSQDTNVSKKPIKGNDPTMLVNNNIPQKNNSVKSNSQNANIQDFGEKIGGARKDLSTPRTNTKPGKEVIHDYTVEKADNGYSVNFKGKVLNDGFKTQAEAEQYILDFKNNIKNNRAFVEERNSLNSLLMTEGNKYLVYLRNPRTLKSQYTGKSFANKQDAENYAMALSMYLKENGKNLFRPQIQKVERINANNKNATKATGDDILNNFGFKGGEFGNWVKQSERQQFLNYAQDAFTDLAAALDITPDSLGQQGAMSIAFGARGQGLTGAVAHFEPGKKVINMTRLKGAGSLAHEYGHSIDNYLSREGGYDTDGMVTQNLRNPKLSDNMKNAIKEVTDAMKYNVSTNQEEIDKKNAIYEKHRVENLEYNLRYIDKVFRGEAKNIRRIKGKYEDVPIKVTEKQKSDYKKIRETLINGNLKGDVDYKLNGQTLKTEKTYPEPIGTLQKMYKEVVGRKLDDDTVYSLYRQGKQARQVTEVKSESGYSKSALELDRATGRSSAYFSRIDEMWARAFESYISDKLKAKGIKDTYLVHSVNNNEYALFNPFPAGEERKNINKAFDNLIQTMKDEGLFTSSGTLRNIDEDTGIRYMNKNYETVHVANGKDYQRKEIRSFKDKDGNEFRLYVLPNNHNELTIKEKGQNSHKTIRGSRNEILKEIQKYWKGEGTFTEISINNQNDDNNTDIRYMKKSNSKSFTERTTDNLGRTLSKQQQEYFKDSKVRNEKGNLETVYHGTLNYGFTEFEGGHWGANYYTNNKNVAESYFINSSKNNGIYEGYLNITNPLEIDVQGRNWSEIRRDFINDKEILELIDQDFGKPYDIFSTTDVIIAAKKSGKYDGVIFKNIYDDASSKKINLGNDYVTFNSNQFKNIDNQNPTSNSDIRLSKNNKEDNSIRNAEREDAYIEQEIKKIEQTGKWDNSIPVTKLTDIRKTIEDYLGLGIKKGFFRQHAYAIYKSNNDVIRTKEYKDIDSILHETGHAMDLGKRLNIDKETIADELLTAIDKLGGYEKESRTIRLEEGFAEVIREYSIIPEQAKKEYPQTIAVLEGLRKTDKKFNDFITKVQQQSYNYIHQNPRNRTLSNISIGEQTDKQNITKNLIKQKVMRNIYDRDYVVKSAVNELAKAGGKTVNQIKASENAYYLTRLASGQTDKVVSMLSDGYIDEHGKKLMPGLNGIGEILGNDTQRWNDLRAYLVAQRDLEYKAKTLKTGLRTADSKAVVEQFKNDKQIQQASKLIYDTLNGVMQYAVNNGLISQVTADNLKQSNAFYVPMQRVLENRGNQVGRRGAVADIIKKRTGSELDIKDVLENIIANSSNIIQQVDNNNVLKALYKEGQASGLTGSIYDVIPAPMTKIGTVQLSTWENELNKQGVNTADLDLDKTIDLFAPNNKVDSKNLITSFINENGKRVYLQFNDELLFNSLMNMDKKFMSQVLKINSKMNMPLRYGATMANLGFAIPNMISDTAQASIYSTAGFIPLVDNAIGVLDIMASKNKTVRNFLNSVAPEYAKRINKIYSLYQQSGATSSTRMSQYRESTQNTMADVYGTKSKTLGIKEKYKPLKRLLDILTYIPEISEQSTRFRVFEKNYEQYKKKGTAETDARILAALESRDATQDFGRTGNVTREINQLIPFSAARVGSIYTFAEKIKANPKQVSMRIAVLTAIAMAIKAIGYDDDEIEELNQRKKDDNFVLRAGDNIVTIKKPQGILRSFINLAEYIQDLTTGHIEEGKEGEKLGNWLNNAIMDNAPADEVTGFVIIENAINKDFYYNTDIVKSYDLDLPDSEQYYDYNSQLAIWLGKIFNYSPAKIDNLISGYFGGLGTSVTGAMDYALGKAGVIPEKPEMGAEQNTIGKRFIVNVNTNSSSIDEIYNRKTELTKKQNGGIITSAEEEELKTIKSAISNMSDLNKQIKEIKKDLTISGEEKAEKIRVLQQEKTDTARKALGKTLIHSENEAKIQRTQFYPNDTLKKNGYSLTLNSSQRKEYEQIANDYYSKYEKQGLYNKEKLEEIKSNAKEYAKNQMFKKYKANLVKTK